MAINSSAVTLTVSRLRFSAVTVSTVAPAFQKDSNICNNKRNLQLVLAMLRLGRF